MTDNPSKAFNTRAVVITLTAATDPDDDFVTAWRVTENNRTITIPVGSATGTYDIDWGDGSYSANVTGDQSHTYEAAGDYTVRISGDFTRIHLGDNPANARKLLSIEQWGSAQWSSMASAFEDARTMTYNATDSPDLSGVSDMSNMFRDAASFNGNLSGWDTSGVTDMSSMFNGAASFNGDISAWNVSRVEYMSSMFYAAHAFNGDISAWDTSSVTNMGAMFGRAASFNGDISAWDTSSVTKMTKMFYSAASFNGDISAWDTSSVTDMRAMFARAASFNGDISAWDTSSVTDMVYMFRNAHAFNGDLSAWDTSGVTKMTSMFRSAASFNGDISTWDTSGVTDMGAMFAGARAFNGNLSAWDTSSVTTMIFMFDNARVFNGDISAWDVSRVEDMTSMFEGARAFNQNLGSWYVTLNDTRMGGDGAYLARIAPQNSHLSGHNPSYSLATGTGCADSGKFSISNNEILTLNSGPGQDAYGICIGASGGLFGTGNVRQITLSANLPTTDGVARINPVPPATPANLQAASATESSVTLTWDDPGDDTITGYKILSRALETQPKPVVLINDTGSANATYTVSGLEPGTKYSFRIMALNDHGESGVSNFVNVRTERIPEPTNRAPQANLDASKYADFIKSENAPRGIMIQKSFDGIFTDPDGDRMIYAASIPPDHATLVSTLHVNESSKILFFKYDRDGDWKTNAPALPDPLTTAVTLTATDPDGLSASLTKYFHYDWESHPELESAEASWNAVTLTFDQEIRETPAPAPNQFTVNVVNASGSTTTNAIKGVTVNGSVVTLELASAPAVGQTLTLDYVHDDDAPLKRSASGGDAALGFTGYPVPLAPCINGVVISNPANNTGLVADCEVLWASVDILDPAGAVITNWDAETPLEDWIGVTVGGTPAKSMFGITTKETVPDEVGGTPLRVTALWLYYTQDLEGSIPENIGSLTELTVLGLGGNQLTGTIPSSLTSLTNLQSLALDGNELTGEIPSDIGNLIYLWDMHLNNNQLTGEIPTSVGNLKKMWHFHLDYNRLTGQIPAEIGEMTSLGQLLMSNNQLTGPIPDLTGNKRLMTIHLQNNQLNGTIPDFSTLPNLQKLHLNGNSLSGCIPAGLKAIAADRWTSDLRDTGLPFCPEPE